VSSFSKARLRSSASFFFANRSW